MKRGCPMATYLKRQVIRIIAFIVLLIIYLINSRQLTTATGYAKSNPGLATKYIGIMLMTMAVILALFAWLYRRQLQQGNPHHFKKRPFTTKSILQLFGFFIGMLAVQVLWSQLIVHHILPMPTNQSEVNAQALQLPFWNNFYSVVAAPVFEEFIFRGFFFNFFFAKNNRWSVFFGILISGCIFGFLHTLSFSVTTLFYSGLGWILAGCYLHFKDIRYDMALHFMNNLWSIL
ncbi:hypothetical protein AYR63_09205 [Secundilactobacillus paracollinoides]|uniref:CAAX prenyl protease 2/Lysostaphin resistance protein A-like domain-containing protein n=2 Tax=Secundilactobacillus paracollinoides TaxID=240427 RepID=A0A1B2IZ26_9LACO|nr:hypothetical protein AYR63_09205 [Secundilactobacillus paracollinoides]